jgi:hypothetical protein
MGQAVLSRDGSVFTGFCPPLDNEVIKEKENTFFLVSKVKKFSAGVDT